jgi:hypothetical protein
MELVDRAGRGSRRWRTGWLGVLAVCAAATLGAATSGCRVNEDDIHRWENTVHGPDKLKAVLLHDKYDHALRVEAALSLIRMRPRKGQRVGIPTMVETLAQVSPEARQGIVASLVPAIIAELKKPPPVAQAGQPSPPDPSYPYKDAAYAMLTFDRTVIVADEQLKGSLKTALVEWAMADFEHRLENRTQAFGMEQLLRYVGAESVAGLPKLMTRDSKRLEQMSLLVKELGDDKTKQAASTALVAVAKYIMSDEWVKVKTPDLQAANAASKLEPTPAQFQAQLNQYQDEELFRVFGAMRNVGGRPAVDFAFEVAAKKEQSEKRRQAALAALEGKLDRNNPDDIKRVLDIAMSDAPDVVLDQAFRRIGEMPREQVVQKLYEIFRTEKWKIRRAAASTVLKMSTVKNLDEFMTKLDDAKAFAMPEALGYGAQFGDLKDGDIRAELKKFYTSKNVPAKTSALGYWFTHGTKNELGEIEAFGKDGQTIPACETDPDCKWTCDVPKEGSKDPKERESKDIKTVGEFVRFCVMPTMKEREQAPKK